MGIEDQKRDEEKMVCRSTGQVRGHDWNCTLDADHEGDHAAKGLHSGRSFATWPRDPELPYGGTTRDLRLQIMAEAGRAESAFRASLVPVGPWSDAEADQNELTAAAMSSAWAVVSLLGWIADKEGDEAAFKAAAMVQDMRINGGAHFIGDLLAPPTP